MVRQQSCADDGAMKAGVVKLTVGLACVLVLSGCDVGLGGGVIVVNNTNRPLRIDGAELSAKNGTWQYGLNGCSDRDLIVLDANGDEYARIEAGWCEGELWTITGREKVTVAAQEQ